MVRAASLTVLKKDVYGCVGLLVRLSEISALYSWRRSGVWAMLRQSVFPSVSGRVFIPWRFQAMELRLSWMIEAEWSVRSMPVDMVPQLVTQWNNVEDMENTSSMWFERVLLKLVHVV